MNVSQGKKMKVSRGKKVNISRGTDRIEIVNNKPYYKYTIQEGDTIASIYNKFSFLKELGYYNFESGELAEA